MNDKPNFETEEDLSPDENAVDSFFASYEEPGKRSGERSDTDTQTSDVHVTSPQALARYLASEVKPQPERRLDLAVEPPREMPVKLQRLARRRQRTKTTGLNWQTPLLLYIATWITVTLAGGFLFAVCVMTILTCHEFGHYFQTRCYRVSASLPYFIPLPVIGLFGTMGAIIQMDGRIPNRRALFDIGISGPLAGLVPTLICCVIGVSQAQVAPKLDDIFVFCDPLLFTFLNHWQFGPIPDEMMIHRTPIGMAGWFGLFLTTLNLFPIGQLDGGHVFYAILGRRARSLSMLLYVAIVVYVIVTASYVWLLILFLLYLMNPRHPPTHDDEPPIGAFRTILGCATLAFIIVGFTINPISEAVPDAESQNLLVRLLLER